MRNAPSEVWAERGQLLLDADGCLWFVGGEDDNGDRSFDRIGPIEWETDAPHGFRREFAYLLDLWLDAAREDERGERDHDYRMAISN